MFNGARLAMKRRQVAVCNVGERRPRSGKSKNLLCRLETLGASSRQASGRVFRSCRSPHRSESTAIARRSATSAVIIGSVYPYVYYHLWGICAVPWDIKGRSIRLRKRKFCSVPVARECPRFFWQEVEIQVAKGHRIAIDSVVESARQRASNLSSRKTCASASSICS